MSGNFDGLRLQPQLAELMNYLADSKTQLAEIKSVLLEKDNAISLLEKRIKTICSTEKPIVKDGCYSFEGDDGLYCTACWDRNMEKIRTTGNPIMSHLRDCPSCKARFNICG